MGADQPALAFLERKLPPAFERRVVVLAPGQAIAYEGGQWRGAIVVVERGQVELECLDQRRYTFRRGDFIWLAGLPLRALHCAGTTSAVLVAVSRRVAEA